MEFTFRGELWFWRGPAPWLFVSVPDDAAGAIGEVAAVVTYGWGMIPVVARVGRTAWTTSLWPKDDGYILPIKTDVRRREGLEFGDLVEVTMSLEAAPHARPIG
ncbi:DUF1905 domain-containing protein [Agromyces intestinalis]|uniref:DUF1905 domain-containing protein n=1 Tax=Agromyces intestinalis TaxID=2592652 RepID=A0A5C1YEC8_9MICO|nr:DUF1905 domain-containing protein [Agromyces intestinalis]QEO13795.1 DUF1905 domain-containing protein [Agromyces intestinalis]